MVLQMHLPTHYLLNLHQVMHMFLLFLLHLLIMMNNLKINQHHLVMVMNPLVPINLETKLHNQSKHHPHQPLTLVTFLGTMGAKYPCR